VSFSFLILGIYFLLPDFSMKDFWRKNVQLNYTQLPIPKSGKSRKKVVKMVAYSFQCRSKQEIKGIVMETHL
jgi:hypothetical protein